MHDNLPIHEFLFGFYSVGELCAHFPQVDHILTGVLELKTAGDTSVRTLSRSTLFHILQWCPTIDVASINTATNGRYAYNTVAGYAATARVASKALRRFIEELPPTASRMTIKEAQQSVDAPHHEELRTLGLL